MKRLFFILTLIIWSVASFAQDNTLKFLGIPVDGTEANMIAQLKQKGFTYDATKKVLKGKFNGRESEIYISTNYGKVDRIYVADAETMNEANIRIRFNNLISQMNNNSKYFSFGNEEISESEDISYEMLVHNKRYQASYSLKTQLTEEDERIVTERAAALKEKMAGQEESEILSAALVETMKYIYEKSTGSVWFMISEHYGKYYISMYYDNLKNRPNGEEL